MALANDQRAQAVRKDLTRRLNHATKKGNVKIAAHIRSLLRDFDELMQIADERVQDAQLQSLRLPAFGDDFVGWLPDDFDDEEDVQ